jgi:hypothetical protein
MCPQQTNFVDALWIKLKMNNFHVMRVKRNRHSVSAWGIRVLALVMQVPSGAAIPKETLL